MGFLYKIEIMPASEPAKLNQADSNQAGPSETYQVKHRISLPLLSKANQANKSQQSKQKQYKQPTKPTKPN